MSRIAILEKYKKMSVVSKATLWFMISSFIQKGLSFVVTPIFTRLLTQEQYGLYSVFSSWLQILAIISTFRLDYSVFNKGMSKYPDKRDEYTSSMLGVTTIITTIMLIGYLIFAKQINAMTELSFVVMMALFVELYARAAVNFWSLRERYEFHYKNVVAYTLIVAILNSGLSILAVIMFEDKGVARILAGALVHAVGGIIIFMLLLKRGKKLWNFEFAKFAVTFNIPLIPHYFSTYIIEQADRIMIQKLVSFEAAALYSVGYTIGGMVKIFTAALTNTLIPLQYNLLGNKQYDELGKNIKSIMLAMVGLVVMVAAAGPEIVLILGGESYLAARAVIPAVASSVYFSFLYTLLANIEFYFDKNKFAMKISVVGAIANVVLNIAIIPVFGYVAAAYTTLFSYVIYAVGHIIYVNRILMSQETSISFPVGFLLKLGALSVVASVLIGLLYDYFIIRCLLVAVICLVVLYNREFLIRLLKKNK